MMIVREARAADANAIAGVHAESWRVAYRGAFRDEYLDGNIFDERLAVWRRRFAAPASNQHVLVAEDQQAVIGFACAFGGEDPRWGTLLENLHVSRRWWKQGIGARLMAAAAAWSAAAYPGRGMYLWVLEPNVPARRFYEQLGAAGSGRELWEAPGGGTVPRLRYVWADLEPLLSHRASPGTRQ